MKPHFRFTVFLVFTLANGAPAAELPQFSVPGYEAEMTALNALHALHHAPAFTDCTRWDAWLPQATLWTGPQARDRYRAAFLNRRIDAEGYVSMQQHRGMAHSEGWPFPAWQQSTGAGFHFSNHHDVWAIQRPTCGRGSTRSRSAGAIRCRTAARCSASATTT